MAGGLIVKDSKKKQKSSQFFSAQNSPEYTKTQSSNQPKTTGLRGILGLNQSVDIKTGQESNATFSKEIYQPSHLNQEINLLFSQQKEELKKAINELIKQIKELSKSAKHVHKDVVSATLQTNPETSLYQVNFMQRLKRFLENIAKNVNEASQWMELFVVKGKQRGKFWDKSKKGGKLDQQYMFSGEHSVSRSVG